MPISSLSFKNVGPFDEVEFDFDPQVNVFTGPNNSGKTTALWVLGGILVFPFGVPKKLFTRDEPAEFTLRVNGSMDKSLDGQLPIVPYVAFPWRTPDEDRFWNESRWSHCVDVMKTVGFTKFIPALRHSTDFRSPGPRVPDDGDEEESTVRAARRSDNIRTRRLTDAMTRRLRSLTRGDPELQKRHSLISSDASLVSDEAVIQKIVELDYRSYLRNKKEFRAIIDQIGQMASEITEGFVIQFSGVDEDADGFFPEFETVDGTLPLNTLSQGTQSVVQWLAHVLISYAEYYDFPDNLRDFPGVLIVDEIDAHLHPSWQRRVIPTLTSHLPNLQVFCSTHSPLMLAGLKAGQVQLLHRDCEGKIVVTTNDEDIVGWTADEILRSFLEIPSPTDLETVRHLNRLEELDSKEVLTVEEQEELDRVRQVVGRDLLNGPVSGLLERFAEDLRRASQ